MNEEDLKIKKTVHNRRSRRKAGVGKGKRFRYRRSLLLLVIVLAAIAAGAFFMWGGGERDMQMERDAVAGQMPGVNHDGAQTQAEEWEILFSININQVFENENGTGYIWFENPVENNKFARLQICRLDNGESLYESGLIKPGYYIAEEKLDVVPEAGEYACKAYIYGYRLGDCEYIGKVETDIVVSVQPSVNKEEIE